MASEYHTIDGIPVTLDKLCRLEPEWSASRIRHLTEQLDATRAELARLRSELPSEGERAALGRLRELRASAYTATYCDELGHAARRAETIGAQLGGASFAAYLRAIAALLAPEGEVSRG